MRKIFIVYVCLLIIFVSVVPSAFADDGYYPWDGEELDNPFASLELICYFNDSENYEVHYALPSWYLSGWATLDTGYISAEFSDIDYQFAIKHNYDSDTDLAVSFPAHADYECMAIDLVSTTAFFYSPLIGASLTLDYWSGCDYSISYVYIDENTYQLVSNTFTGYIPHSSSHSLPLFPASLNGVFGNALNDVVLITNYRMQGYWGYSYTLDGSLYGVSIDSLSDVPVNWNSYLTTRWNSAVNAMADRAGSNGYDNGFTDGYAEGVADGESNSIADVTVWLGQTLDGIMSVKLFGTFSLADVLGVVVSCLLMLLILKWLFGG